MAPHGTVVTFLCVAEYEAEMVRFKKKEPGYKYLVLSVVGSTNDVMDFRPCDVHTCVCGANFFTKLKRID